MPQNNEITLNNIQAFLERHSNYLSKLANSENEFLESIKKNGFEKCFSKLISELEKFDISKSSKDELMDFLRTKKRQASLLIAVADIIEEWDLKKTTNALSDFADISIRLCVQYLLNEKKKEKIIKSAKPEDSGYIVIAVGKLGGRELNYSSDIDLIILYDSDSKNYCGKLNAKKFYISITQSLVEMLQKFTGEGYVFRVDLRLRPDPYSTPIAISTKSAETYYQNVGQNWERAAMIKSRFIAGDEKLAISYLKFLDKFIWRKYLDFNAIKDIHSIKRQIDSQKNYDPGQLEGYNIKVGKGGIREIEFFAQVQQLIWGGREIDLRTNETCVAIRKLEESDRLSKIEADELISIYQYYRKIEHRLQMIDDEARHTLPVNNDEMLKFALFMGYKNTKAFKDDLLKKLTRIQQYYADLFTEAPSLGAEGNLVFTGVSNDPETLVTLSKMGFSDPEKICGFMRGWHHGRRRATRTKRVREILTEITPDLLKSFAQSSDSTTAFSRFDSFLNDLPSGEQIFSLFNERPQTIKLCAEIMGNSPWLAENFGRSGNLATKILRSDFSKPMPKISSLESNLNKILETADSHESKLKIIRRWKHDMEFQIGVRLLKKFISHQKALSFISKIAELAIQKVLIESMVSYNNAEQKICIVAMGRLGEKQLTFGSDLDLVFVYEKTNERSTSEAKKIAQKFTKIMTSISEDGMLYPVDTRLRPLGEQGTIATSLDSYKQYYKNSAWSWEFMALTKARPVTGDKKLKSKVSKVIQYYNFYEKDKKTLASEMYEMRAKVAKQFNDNDPWDIKHAKGGLFEIDFIIQYFKLSESHDHPEILKYNQEKFWQLLKNNSLLSNKVADELSTCFDFLRDIQSVIRLISQSGFDSNFASENQKNLIVDNMNCKDFSEVEEKLLKTQNTVNKYFEIIFNGDKK